MVGMYFFIFAKCEPLIGFWQNINILQNYHKLTYSQKSSFYKYNWNFMTGNVKNLFFFFFFFFIVGYCERLTR